MFSVPFLNCCHYYITKETTSIILKYKNQTITFILYHFPRNFYKYLQLRYSGIKNLPQLLTGDSYIRKSLWVKDWKGGVHCLKIKYKA